MAKDKEQIIIEEYNRFSSLMANIHDFVQKNQFISFIEFDNYVAHNLTLFSIEPSFDFNKLEKSIQHIRKAIPSVKRIFNRPIIILKDTEDVMPVENTRIINQKTFLHLANHSHHVSNITRRGVKPRKLLTRLYEDDYSIYENIIFCNTIDEILLLVKKNRRTLENLLYASDIMKFNLLEKVNHMNFFMALGKLHTGYIRDFNQYFSLSRKMLHELSLIIHAIKPRLHKPVYKKNIRRNKHLTLKKTNIFLKQKDYRQVFKTYKYILGNQIKDEEQKEKIDLEVLSTNYLIYVKMLMLFAIGHFNFKMDPLIKMDLNKLDVIFTYRGWTLNISNNNKNEILLIFTKEKTHKMMITNNGYNDAEITIYKHDNDLNEVINVSPFNEDYLEREDVYISMDDIDSFRRLQQILLKGMIYSDSKRDVCPFCGGTLHENMRHGFYQCQDCMIQIKESVCKETNEPFFYTDNANQKKYVTKKTDFEYDEHWYYEKQIESLMHFRNITRINQNGEIICPHCYEVHEK